VSTASINRKVLILPTNSAAVWSSIAS